MYGLVDPKITTAFKVHMYIQNPAHPHTLTSSHPIPSSPHTTPHPSHPHSLTSLSTHILTSSSPHTLIHSHPHPLTPSSPHPLTSSSPHTLTLWVVGDWQGQHDSLGEKCRVTLVTRVQGKPYLCDVKRACKCMTCFDYSIAGIFCGAVIFTFFMVKWDP